MKTLFRVLGAAAAVAATGAAIVVLDKVLNDKGPLHVEEVEFPEEAEKDPAEAAKAAEAYAEGEAKTGGTDVRMTHDQIARYMGSAREVVSRLLKYFAGEGLVRLYRGGVTVLDKERLKQIANGT